jgi:hypothetical protein
MYFGLDLYKSNYYSAHLALIIYNLLDNLTNNNMDKPNCDCGTCSESDFKLMNECRMKETGHLESCSCEKCRDFKDDWVSRVNYGRSYPQDSDLPIQRR